MQYISPDRKVLVDAAHNRNYAEDASTEILTPVQVAELLRALTAVGQYGEVHLVVSRGQIRFIRIVQSRTFPSS